MVRWLFILVFLFLGQCLIAQATVDSALLVLETKCNICHKVEKEDVVFTRENMSEYYKQINRQVFIFKLMPKGKEVKLTKKEKEHLKVWIKKTKKAKK